MTNLKLFITASMLAMSSPAFAEYSYGKYCSDIHLVLARRERAMLQIDPEGANNFAKAAYEFTEMRANTIGENRSDVNLFTDCTRDLYNSRSSAGMVWDGLKRAATVNPCDDGQTFVYGSGCVSNDTAAILNALKQR